MNAHDTAQANRIAYRGDIIFAPMDDTTLWSPLLEAERGWSGQTSLRVKMATFAAS